MPIVRPEALGVESPVHLARSRTGPSAAPFQSRFGGFCFLTPDLGEIRAIFRSTRHHNPLTIWTQGTLENSGRLSVR
jgi:hypothetical protein